MKKIIIILQTFLLLMTSCSDFTDLGLPRDQITKELVFQDVALANSAMAGIYRALEESGFLSGGASGAGLYLACYSDEFSSYAAMTADVSEFDFLTHNTRSSAVSSIWTNSYKQIYYINSAIEGLGNSYAIDQSVKDRLLGESLFLRALLHLYLTNTFGDIPYVETISYEDNSKLSREVQNEVYKKIERDLQQALQLLPETYARGNRVKPTKIAAYTILARLAYYQKQWNDAIRYSTYVISNESYAMESTLDAVFLKESSGTIWSLLPYNNTYNTQEANLFILKVAPPTKVALRESFVDSFTNDDLRRNKWIGEIKDTQNKSYYYSLKYKQAGPTTASMEHSVILRIEELYLIRSEAYIQNNLLALGLQDLNKIRNRAALSATDSQDVEYILKAILNERKHELFTEFGHRFYDLKHFEVLDEVLLQTKPNWKSYYKWWPIPEKELLLNPNLKPQNNGY